MEFNIEFRGSYFFCMASGVAEVERFGDLLDSIFGDEKWAPGSSYVVDQSDLDVRNITIADVQQIAIQSRSKRAAAGVARSAIIAPRDLEFGLCRMWMAYVNDESDIATGVFRTQEEAIAWVSA